MNSLLFYFIPLIIFGVINNWIEQFSWPYYLVLLLAFLLFQLARLRYPKDAVPGIAKISQGLFYALTVAIILRDKYLDAALVNVLIAFTLVAVLVEISQNRKKPSQ
ncbi:hypothetical protein BN1080_01596 [Planococcus massiliensis]|uniref:Uncharacterized protein n=1 Tax=Planococcus massiliensis TaxID=1499687 RepID=A0A098EK41_9BACL|nr:hypothetical protein [Planococcus massiliensis]CEG22663.1 hypothetical protein BN1080_01596 [Planococcus massiliensis]